MLARRTLKLQWRKRGGSWRSSGMQRHFGHRSFNNPQRRRFVLVSAALTSAMRAAPLLLYQTQTSFRVVQWAVITLCEHSKLPPEDRAAFRMGDHLSIGRTTCIMLISVPIQSTCCIILTLHKALPPTRCRLLPGRPPIPQNTAVVTNLPHTLLLPAQMPWARESASSAVVATAGRVNILGQSWTLAKPIIDVSQIRSFAKVVLRLTRFHRLMFTL